MKLSTALPRMNQLACLYDMKLSNPKHLKFIKLMMEFEQYR